MSNETSIQIEIIKVMPLGLYYDFKTRIYASALDTEQKCLNYINLIIRENNDDFITELKKKNEEGFIRELESQYNYYYNKTKDCSLWLQHTDKLIRQNVKDRYFILAFDNWLNSKKVIKKELVDLIWFKVGLLFASGEIDGLMLKYNKNATHIAGHFKNKSMRVYITESLSNLKTSDKNIFSDQAKLKAIQNYCNQNSIEIATSFLDLIEPN
jgi:hypothetical protein